MCGIAGIVSDRPFAPSAVGAMCEVLSHRGPDDAGIELWADHRVGLGHTRLSIIDLTAAGRNPMANEDGTVWVVFNGEIYNFRALRRELEGLGHCFRSASDTEVIVHAYEEWGDAHVARLRGMFAYAIYDRRRLPQPARGPFRLLLVRDRIGIKPLFYGFDGRRLLFASEIKGVLAAPGVDRAQDRSALFDYLTYGYVPPPKTAYLAVRRLAAGHLLAFEGGRVDIRGYWDVPLGRPSPVANETEAVELVRDAVTDAVKVSLESDVPLGTFLSGGIDSSIVTAIMAGETRSPVSTFSIDFDVRSETPYARLIANRYRTNHHEEVVGRDRAEPFLGLIPSLYDEPFADGSAIPTYQVCSLARNHVKVALSGDGGDELFAGYIWYWRWLRRRRFERIPEGLRRTVVPFLEAISPKGSRLKRVLSDLGVDALEQYARLLERVSPAEKREVLAPQWKQEFRDYDDYWYFRQYWHAEIDPLTRVQYLDLKTYLPDDILTKVDRASMAVSLEVRPPLLDHQLVEQVFAIPARWRAPNGASKHLLKRAFADLIPREIRERQKQGFSSPLSQWMQIDNGWAMDRLRSLPALETLLRDDLRERAGIFKSGARIWALLVLQQWSRQEGSMPRDSAILDRTASSSI